MMNNKQQLWNQLEKLNISKDEAKLYVELLEKPNTHLQLARATGINRTKVYRLIEKLEERQLVIRRVDDRGVFLVANDPGVLKIEMAAEEAEMKCRRGALRSLIPCLRSYRDEAERSFEICTYVGSHGLKQMQWHELKSDGEVLVFGNVTIEDMSNDRYWSEKIRERIAELGYRTRELYNDPCKEPNFTDNRAYMSLYEARRINNDILPVATPMVIYNDVVEIFQFSNQERVGIEIKSRSFAHTMRSIFEQYWLMGEKIE